MKQLQDAVMALSGVGEKRAESLATLGIFTIEDLLLYFPFRFDDIQERSLSDIQDQEKVVLKGTVATPAVVTYFGPRKKRLTFQMIVEHVPIRVTFFNQAFLQKQIIQDEEIAIYGKWDATRKSLSGIKIMGNQTQGEDFAPIYHVNKKVKQPTLISLIRQAYQEYQAVIPEILPQEYVQQYGLLSRKEAIYQMHFPSNATSYQRAHQRMAYEEFFVLEMKMQMLKATEGQKAGATHRYDVQLLRQFIQQLPFELTDAQKRVTNDICRDLLQPVSMNRLLQGDVGSGKTVVAALALYAVTTAHYQGALLVPTEILAEQHFNELQTLCQHTSLRIALLKGSTPPTERRTILEQLADGTIDIIVGTHALIQDSVHYHRLGIAVIDEQHRFGVNQRRKMREKGQGVDILSMTATPIPRTLAITAYGDMDVSVIDELPKGRKLIKTEWLKHEQFHDLLQQLQQPLSYGEQIYVICPLIAESEAIDAKNAEALYKELCQYFEPHYHIGLLHGKMKADEKEALMDAFTQNHIQILVSTTVIEVGVNVPNATRMIIMDADRFGLAQLHQLRGRVGRGVKQSYCYLVANPKNKLGEERMTIMTQTSNGFTLSEKDLEMRGPGEFFGAKQSGVPEFRVADLVQDQVILDYAVRDAKRLIQQPHWEDEDAYSPLVYYLSQHMQPHLD